MGDRNNHQPDSGTRSTDETVSQACPECGGAMKLHRMGRLFEYNCHVGHRFGLKTMIAEKSGLLERNVWSALAQSQELVALLEQAKPGLDPETSASIDEEIAQRKQEHVTLRTLTERSRTPSLTS